MPMPKMKTFSVEDGALMAPCMFCGYIGQDFYMAGTHKKTCPWYTIAGLDKRKALLTGATEKAQAAIKASLLASLLGKNVDNILFSLIEQISELRQLLWLAHCGLHMLHEKGKGAPMVCPNCGADFSKDETEMLEKYLWRCSGKKGF